MLLNLRREHRVAPPALQSRARAVSLDLLEHRAGSRLLGSAPPALQFLQVSLERRLAAKPRQPLYHAHMIEVGIGPAGGLEGANGIVGRHRLTEFTGDRLTAFDRHDPLAGGGDPDGDVGHSGAMLGDLGFDGGGEPHVIGDDVAEMLSQAICLYDDLVMTEASEVSGHEFVFRTSIPAGPRRRPRSPPIRRRRRSTSRIVFDGLELSRLGRNFDRLVFRLKAEDFRTKATGRVGMILPDALPAPHRDTRPVGWSPNTTPGGIRWRGAPLTDDEDCG